MIGHLDTVLEGEPFRREGARAYGSGASDMKGGDVVMVEALRALAEEGLLAGRRVVVVLTGDEEEKGGADIGGYSVWAQGRTEEEWDDPAVRCVAALLDGRCAGEPGPTVLLAFNASRETVTFTLPPQAEGTAQWKLRVDTAQGHFSDADAASIAAGGQLELPSHAMAVLVQPTGR